MTKPITPEMITAWRKLQQCAKEVRRAYPESSIEERWMAEAIDVLDNSNFMVPIERAEEEVASPVLGESLDPPHGRGKCPHCGHPRVPLTAEGLTMYHGDVKSGQGDCLGSLCPPEKSLDPAEWGDTTREDMARHQREQDEAVIAAGGEVHVVSIPLSELTGEGLRKALRKKRG